MMFAILVIGPKVGRRRGMAAVAVTVAIVNNLPRAHPPAHAVKEAAPAVTAAPLQLEASPRRAMALGVRRGAIVVMRLAVAARLAATGRAATGATLAR
jgi:hypothetical protein